MFLELWTKYKNHVGFVTSAQHCVVELKPNAHFQFQ